MSWSSSSSSSSIWSEEKRCCFGARWLKWCTFRLRSNGEYSVGVKVAGRLVAFVLIVVLEGALVVGRCCWGVGRSTRRRKIRLITHFTHICLRSLPREKNERDIGTCVSRCPADRKEVLRIDKTILTHQGDVSSVDICHLHAGQKRSSRAGGCVFASSETKYSMGKETNRRGHTWANPSCFD